MLFFIVHYLNIYDNAHALHACLVLTISQKVLLPFEFEDEFAQIGGALELRQTIVTLAVS